MSVLIKGMKMPSCCMFCPLSNSCGCGLTNPPVLMTSKEMLADRPDWCPLFPVPPHGRLIDESKISLAEYEQAAHDALHNGKGSIMYDSGVLAGARAITQLVRRAPTIIPAEEAEDAESGRV